MGTKLPSRNTTSNINALDQLHGGGDVRRTAYFADAESAQTPYFEARPAREGAQTSTADAPQLQIAKCGRLKLDVQRRRRSAEIAQRR